MKGAAQHASGKDASHPFPGKRTYAKSCTAWNFSPTCHSKAWSKLQTGVVATPGQDCENQFDCFSQACQSNGPALTLGCREPSRDKTAKIHSTARRPISAFASLRLLAGYEQNYPV